MHNKDMPWFDDQCNRAFALRGASTLKNMNNQNNIIIIFWHLFDKYSQQKLPKFGNCSCNRFLVRPI